MTLNNYSHQILIIYKQLNVAHNCFKLVKGFILSYTINVLRSNAIQNHLKHHLEEIS